MINISNKSIRAFIIALLIFSGGFIVMQNVFAQSLVVGELIKTGKELYENGQYEDAIHEFSKVLLVESRNEDALFYLKEMGLDGGVYGSQKTAIDHIYDLNEEIIAHRNELQKLEDQNRSQEKFSQQLQEQKVYLENMIVQKEQEKKGFIEAGEEFRVAANMKLKEQQGHIDDLESSNQGKKQELIRLNTDMVEVKQELVLDKGTLEKKIQELDDLKNDFEKHQNLSEEEVRVLRIKYENELAGLEENNNILDQEVFDIKEQYRKNMRKYHAALVDKEAELKMEKNLSTVKSYRIAQQEGRYLEMKEALNALRKDKGVLADEAGILRDQIGKLKRKKTFRYSESLLDPSEDKLTDYIQKQDGVIIDLKARMVSLLGEIDALKKQGTEKDAEKIEDLEKQVDGLKKEIDDKAGELNFSQKQQSILSDRIDEYRERLGIVEGMIQDKEERILFLEEQLGADVYK